MTARGGDGGTLGRAGDPLRTDRNTTAACCDIYASDIIVTRAGVHFLVDTPAGRGHVHLPLLGRHQVYAALAAIGVGLHFGAGLDAVAQRLAALPRLPGRLNPLPGRRGSLILDDTYGASPAAVEAALETLAALEARRRVAVLGDMLELAVSRLPARGRGEARRADRRPSDHARQPGAPDGRRGARGGLASDQVVATYTPRTRPRRRWKAWARATWCW